MRGPQSAQSVPRAQIAFAAPGPPSWHFMLLALGRTHVLLQPGTATVVKDIASRTIIGLARRSLASSVEMYSPPQTRSSTASLVACMQTCQGAVEHSSWGHAGLLAAVAQRNERCRQEDRRHHKERALKRSLASTLSLRPERAA